jgi:X-X-X-Leu-X-X-Gly heptad repeat protein
VRSLRFVETSDNGTQTLDNGAQTLDNGAQSLDNGAQTLDNGADRVDSGNHHRFRRMGEADRRALRRASCFARQISFQFQLVEPLSGLSDALSGLSDALSGLSDALSKRSDALSGLSDALSKTVKPRFVPIEVWTGRGRQWLLAPTRAIR